MHPPKTGTRYCDGRNAFEGFDAAKAKACQVRQNWPCRRAEMAQRVATGIAILRRIPAGLQCLRRRE